MIRKLSMLCALVGLLVLGGCATPLGQQYGIVGGAGGAAIGGAAGGVEGAIIGGALGALGGGLIGDQQEMNGGRYNRGYDDGYRPAPRPRCHMEPSIRRDYYGRTYYDYDHPVRVCERPRY